MLSLILGFITGLSGPISAVINNITDLKKAKIEADSKSEKLKLDQQIQEAHDRKAVLVAEAGSRLASGLNASMRFALALGPMAVLLKLFLWDKVLGSIDHCSGPAARGFKECSVYLTDPLDLYQWSVITAVIAFYFVYDIAANSRK